MFSIQIIEGGTLRTTVLAEVTLPMCDGLVSLDKIGLTALEFVSSSKFKHDHAGIDLVVVVVVEVEVVVVNVVVMSKIVIRSHK